MSRQLLPVLFFLLLLGGTIWAYWPGLHGGFLFDDEPNLEALGNYGGVTDFASFKSFVLGGDSGPSGRPVALMSFLLNDNDWPTNAAFFKPTNLKIHLLVGLFLCWSAVLLLRFYDVEEKKAVWIAVLGAGIWLLHPYMVSTTLYVVQRMAQLAALFMVMGIAGYLHGRLLLETRPRLAYVWMSLSLALGTLLATLSKENGALLPLLVAVIEGCRPAGARYCSRLCRSWRMLFFWLPASAIFILLFRMLDFSETPWPNRSFNQIERLLTEGRVLLDYLFNLFIPRVEGVGLYQDGFVISKGLLSPPETLFSWVIIAALLFFAFFFRKKWSLLCLAILFFFVSQLVESTIAGLELYFEHRNYVAALFLFFPIAAGIIYLAALFGRVWPLAIVTLVAFSMLTMMTRQRAQLWSDVNVLQLFWAANALDSPRAQNKIAESLYLQGRDAEATAFLDSAANRFPESGLLTISTLLKSVGNNRAAAEDFILAGNRLKTQAVEAQTLRGLRMLVDAVRSTEAKPEYRDLTLGLIAALEGNRRYARFSVFQRMAPYLKGLLMVRDEPEVAFEQFQKAIGLHNDTDASLAMVAEMATAGHYGLALDLLEEARNVYVKQPDKTLKRPREIYDKEIVALESAIRQDQHQHEVIP